MRRKKRCVICFVSAVAVLVETSSQGYFYEEKKPKISIRPWLFLWQCLFLKLISFHCVSPCVLTIPLMRLRVFSSKLELM